MKQLIALLVVVMVVIGGGSIYYFYYIGKIKSENRLLGENIDRLTAKYKVEGLDRYYQGLKTTELISAHKNTLKAYDRYIDDMGKMAELGCREKFILEALESRGVDTEKLVREHLGMETPYKNSFDHNVRIISVKLSIILTLLFFEIMVCGTVVFCIIGINELADTAGWNTKLLFSEDFLLMLFILFISIYGTYGVFVAIKTSTYIVKLEDEEFSYKFIFKRIIPYSEIEKLQYLRNSYGRKEGHVLCIKLKNKKAINLRLDHLYFYKSAEVIRPRDAGYLNVPGDEDLILEFFSRKTGKTVEGKY